MNYLLSMDGGGSKTAWLLTTESGKIAARHTMLGCSHTQIGMDNVLNLIGSGIKKLLDLADCKKEDIIGAAFGVPCYGEYPEIDLILSSRIHQFLPDAIITICNDVELGFAGSLCLDNGIHLVAGTGAIAFGRNSSGQTARSNGWHPIFSDEGSGYWLGMQTLSLFTKQADERIPRSTLYSIVLEKLSLSNAEDIINFYDNTLAGDRRKIASLQLLLKEAAISGDSSAIHLYESAAHELYLSIRSVYQTLSFSSAKEIKVSYSGGLFFKDNYILDPLTRLTQQLSVVLVPPALPPVYGGILLSMQGVSYEKAKKLINILKLEYNKEERNGSN